MSDNIQHAPPQIIHSEPRPQEYRQMIEDAARNIHLRRQSASLLICYASHANRFRPALKLISEQTKIAPQDISKVRKRLVEHGLIDYSAEHGFIFIDWQRIRAFAMLEKPLRLPQSKLFRFGAAAYLKPRLPTIGQLTRGLHIVNPRP